MYAVLNGPLAPNWAFARRQRASNTMEATTTMRRTTRPPTLGRALVPVLTGLLVVACEASAPSVGEPTASPAQATVAATVAPTPQLTPAPELEPVTLRLDGPISGMHAPFVAGIAENFFSAEGIALELAEGDGSRTSVDGVATGADLVAFADATAMTAAAADDASVQMVACFVQQTPFAAVGYGDLSGPGALAGQTIGYVSGGVPLLWEAFKARNGISSSNVNEVDLQRDDLLSALEDGRIDVAIGATTAYGFAATGRDGGTLNVLHFSDWDASALAHGLVVHADTIRDNPELVRRIVAASVSSWQYAAENPDATVAAFIAAYPDADRNVVASQLAETLALVQTEASLGQSLGYMTEADWQATLKLLQDSGGLAGDVRITELYTNTFLFRH